MDEIAGEFAGKVKVGKIDVNRARATAGQYQIEVIPTLVLFKGGQEISRKTGAPSKAALAQWLAQAQGGN